MRVGDSSRRCEEIVKKSRIAPLNAIIIISSSSSSISSIIIIIKLHEKVEVFLAIRLTGVKKKCGRNVALNVQG